MSRPFANWSTRRRESREFQAEMAGFYGKLPAGVQSQLRRWHEHEARTVGTLAYRNERERRRPWLVLVSILVIAAIVILVIIASGDSLTGFSKWLLA